MRTKSSGAGVPLVQLARVIRSKNAGPYELTLDVIFKSRSGYERAKRSGAFSRMNVARMYRVKAADILRIVWFEPSCAVKVTMRRWQPSGGPGERDVYGAQQHGPLLGMRV